MVNPMISKSKLAAWLHLEPDRYKKLIEGRPDIAAMIANEFKKAGDQHD